MIGIRLRKPNSIFDWLRIHTLYRRAFPPEERKPFSVIRRMHRQGRADVWCVEEEGEFAGFASTVNGGELILLDYLAIAPRYRGWGIGTAAMAQMQQIYGDKGFFVEIESTRENAPNREERQKRKHFYEAAGMEAMDVYVDVFGVQMELLGSRCRLDFDGYRAFYRDHYSPRAACHIQPVSASHMEFSDSFADETRKNL